jgi:hypothetical protein
MQAQGTSHEEGLHFLELFSIRAMDTLQVSKRGFSKKSIWPSHLRMFPVNEDAWVVGD